MQCSAQHHRSVSDPVNVFYSGVEVNHPTYIVYYQPELAAACLQPEAGPFVVLRSMLRTIRSIPEYFVISEVKLSHSKWK